MREDRKSTRATRCGVWSNESALAFRALAKLTAAWQYYQEKTKYRKQTSFFPLKSKNEIQKAKIIFPISKKNEIQKMKIFFPITKKNRNSESKNHFCRVVGGLGLVRLD